MEITIAKTAGFCMGVERAVHLALKNSDNGKKELYTLGPLIHNTQTIKMLEKNNVTPLPVDGVNVPKGTNLLIRAHGISPYIENEYRNKGYNLIDGTCPKVKLVHRVITKYKDLGYDIIITGDEGHAEVIGLMGYTEGHGHLIGSVDEIGTLPNNLKKICIVSQTTFNMVEYDDVVDKIRLAYPDSDVICEKTICSATDRRQTEVIDVCAMTEMMVIVGGKHSANTLRLAEMAGQSGKPVVHIEDTTELTADHFTNVRHIGITAGASTPGWLVEEVVDKIKDLCA